MAQYIDKDALIAEIEKLMDEIYAGRPFDSLSREQQVALWYVKSIISSINTLEVKEVDLEKEIQAFAKMELEPIKIYDANVGITITMHQLCQCAKHFFELGLKMSQKLKTDKND